MTPGEIVVSGGLWLALPIALAAGLLSFLSPCVLPLVPGYLGYVSGVARDDARRRSRMVAGVGALHRRVHAWSSSLFFVLAGTFGVFFLQYRDLLLRIGGVRDHPARARLHRAGHLAAAHHQAALAAAHRAARRAAARRRVRPRLDAVHRPDARGGQLPRRSTAATPAARCCIGLFYCLGLGIPFLLVALGFGWVGGSIAWVKRHIRAINIAGGVLLIAIGVLMVTRRLDLADVEPRGGDRGLWHRALTGPPITSTTTRRSAGRPPAAARPASATLRFFWRQLTSMRTALFLLLLLALAAVPGSLVPQRTSDPNGVLQFEQNDPETFEVLDNLGLFSTFTSPWFSAIYLLLFISLVGCVIPRTKHHFDAMRAPPAEDPRPARAAGRLHVARRPQVDAGVAIDEAAKLLKRQGYRVERYGDERVSAERGYLRETGNLVFHTALVGMLLTVGIGGGFGYTGQRVLVEGEPFTNVLASYDSFNPGRFFDETVLEPYSMRLDDFEAHYELDVHDRRLAPAGLHGEPQHPHARRRLDPGIPQGQLAAHGRRHRRLPARQRLRPGDHGARPRRRRRVQRTGAVPAARRQPAQPRRRQGARRPRPSRSRCTGFFYPDPIQLDDGTYTSFSPIDHGESLLTLVRLHRRPRPRRRRRRQRVHARPDRPDAARRAATGRRRRSS